METWGHRNIILTSPLKKIGFPKKRILSMLKSDFSILIISFHHHFPFHLSFTGDGEVELKQGTN